MIAAASVAAMVLRSATKKTLFLIFGGFGAPIRAGAQGACQSTSEISRARE
jgi:hypothetical protein